MNELNALKMQNKALKKKTKKSPPKKRTQPKRKVARVPPGMTDEEAECTRKYFHSLIDPFDAYAKGACLPIDSNGMSQKVTGFIRQQVTIGTAGYGFVAICPSLGNDVVCMLSSNASFTGTAIETNSTLVTGVDASACANLPWSQAELFASGGSEEVSGRIVSVGLRAQYNGTVLDRGGAMYALVHPDRSNMDGFGIDAFGNYTQSTIKATDQSKRYLVMSAQHPRERAWSYENANSNYEVFPFGGGWDYSAAAVYPCTAGILFTGKPGNTFLIEYVIHCEYVGAKSQPFLTRSHNSPEAFAKIGNIQQSLATSENTLATGNSMWSKTKQAIMEYSDNSMAYLAPRLMHAAGGMAVRAISNAASGYLSITNG